MATRKPRKRPVGFLIRLSAEEAARVRAAAARCGLTIGPYTRMLLLRAAQPATFADHGEVTR